MSSAPDGGGGAGRRRWPGVAARAVWGRYTRCDDEGDWEGRVTGEAHLSVEKMKSNLVSLLEWRPIFG